MDPEFILNFWLDEVGPKCWYSYDDSLDGLIERKRKTRTRIKSAPTRHAKFVIPRIREEIETTGLDYC